MLHRLVDGVEYLLPDFLRLEGVLDEQALQKSLFHGGQSYPREKWCYG
jgi:hypothetical protein